VIRALMIYRVTLKRLTGGEYYARCEAGPNGLAEGVADTAGGAVEEVRKEIRYQLEYCPCSGVSRDYVELEVRDLT
jgi:hypothetical protein